MTVHLIGAGSLQIFKHQLAVVDLARWIPGSMLRIAPE
jgi:hypothetical protein